MTADEFNALPLQARLYIEKQQGCQSCGKAQDIDGLYKKYLTMKNKALYTLRTGAVPYADKDGKGGVLYPIHPKDTQEAIRSKLAQALIVYAVRPDKFTDFDETNIKGILEEAAEAAEAEAAEAAEAEAEAEAEAAEAEAAEAKAEAAEAAEAKAEAKAEATPVKVLYGAAKAAAEAKAAKETEGLD